MDPILFPDDPKKAKRPAAPADPSALDLFAPPKPHRTAATSRAAKASNAPAAPTQRQRVLEAIRAAGSAGRTRSEIARELGISKDSVNGRCRELLDAEPVPLVVVSGSRSGEAVLVLR